MRPHPTHSRSSLGRTRARSLIAVVLAALGLGLLATPAAARPYKFTGTQLYLTSHGQQIAGKKDDGIVFNQVQPLTLHAVVRGPERGRGIKRVAVTIKGISCVNDCHTDRFSMRPGRLSRYGYAFPSHRTDTWGCGRPKVIAKLILRSGRVAAKSKWRPQTGCGE